MLENIRNNEQGLLLLECGSVFPDTDTAEDRLTAELTMKAMDKMGYAAMNLGAGDFSLGADFLTNIKTDVNFPLISSNLIRKDTGKAFGESYIVRNIGEIKIAILGIMPSEAFKKISNPKYFENLEIIPPETALEKLVPEVRKQADIVFLLSQSGFEETVLLMNTVKGIDIAISSGSGKKGCLQHITQPPDTSNIFQAAPEGLGLGYLKLTYEDKKLVNHENQTITLFNPAPAEDLVSNLFDEVKKMTGAQERQKMEAEAKELLKLKPEEYMKKMLEKQNGLIITK
jgi:2',3'-cyclic-nucleotide 2'-phosphodiesterase (5'-nucleotidase family)